MPLLRRTALALLGAAAGSALVLLATHPLSISVGLARAATSATASANAETYRQLQLFGDIYETVRGHYVDKPDETKMIGSAINGMLSGLDPHSSYMDANSFRDMQVETKGEFGGLGMEVTMEDGALKVVTPIDDTPAARAGIMANDIITHLNGESIQSLSLDQAIEKMRGPVNTAVKLTITRKGQEKPLEVSITRDVIRVSSVRSHLEGDDVGYVRLTQFTEQTTDGLSKAISDITAKSGDKLKGFILDLRNNPGGLLDQAVSVSNAFLNRGEIVSIRGREPEDMQRFEARPDTGDLTKGKPLIILINGGSASASEIVAGALQDHRRGTLIGTRSFGKGSVQTIIPLGSADGALRLTTARYYTPSGRSIQALGITPEIVELQDVPADLKGEELGGEASLRGHLKATGEEEKGSQSYIPTNPKDDKVLNLALDLMRGTQTNPAFPPNPQQAGVQ
ncbi:MAG TPA: S41 family peptidase [Xanthobacteraceae bacterium]|jgi:carboxyl-terminal processing protease